MKMTNKAKDTNTIDNKVNDRCTNNDEVSRSSLTRMVQEDDLNKDLITVEDFPKSAMQMSCSSHIISISTQKLFEYGAPTVDRMYPESLRSGRMSKKEWFTFCNDIDVILLPVFRLKYPFMGHFIGSIIGAYFIGSILGASARFFLFADGDFLNFIMVVILTNIMYIPLYNAVWTLRQNKIKTIMSKVGKLCCAEDCKRMDVSFELSTRLDHFYCIECKVACSPTNPIQVRTTEVHEQDSSFKSNEGIINVV